MSQPFVEVVQTIKVPMTSKLMADVFTNMNDEEQAQFFIDVAENVKDRGESWHMQWFAVGRHLRDCGCSTVEARSLVRGIVNGIED